MLFAPQERKYACHVNQCFPSSSLAILTNLALPVLGRILFNEVCWSTIHRTTVYIDSYYFAIKVINHGCEY